MKWRCYVEKCALLNLIAITTLSLEKAEAICFPPTDYLLLLTLPTLDAAICSSSPPRTCHLVPPLFSLTESERLSLCLLAKTSILQLCGGGNVASVWEAQKPGLAGTDRSE